MAHLTDRRILILLLALALPRASLASFILQIEGSTPGTPSGLAFTLGQGNLVVSGALTHLQGGDGTDLFTSFGVAFDGATDPNTGGTVYLPIPGQDQFYVRTATGAIAYQGTIAGRSLLFTLSGEDRYSVSVPIFGTIGPTAPDSLIYPVSLVFSFDLTRPAGQQVESGFIVYGEPNPSGGVPEPSSLVLLGLGSAVALISTRTLSGTRRTTTTPQ